MMTADNPKLVVKVQCQSGYRGEETPLRFAIGDRWVEVMEVLDRWLDPERRYFKLRGDDEGIYILRHSSEAGCWDIIMFGTDARQ